MCTLTWDEIYSFTKLLTNLKHPKIAFNDLDNPPPTFRLPNLEKLVLESNKIQSLEFLDVISFVSEYIPSTFRNNKLIRSLNISLVNNPLGPYLPHQKHFNITTLNLNDTGITSWENLSQMSLAFPRLRSLRISSEILTNERYSHNSKAYVKDTLLLNSSIL
jgi:hypothetical protein